MKSSQTKCRPEAIERFLNDALSNDESTSLEEHLSSCETCQAQFERTMSALELDSDSAAWLAQSDRLGLRSGSPLQSFGTLTWDRESMLELSKRLLPPSDNPAMIGRLGEFEILEPLGAGGMGIVYKGYDHELNRFVAVKVLSPSLSISGAAKQRFLREAQAAAGVVHPHVVPIHAVSSEGQLPYLVMGYIPGENLQEYLSREGAMPLGEALRIAHQVALGLSAAHQHGVIHRDVKPGNILLERNVQRALLTDFGLARAADDASLTHSGLLAGTPNYMSPEQARGESIDARSDLFGLGSILYTMLAGHPPFRGEHAYVVLRRLADESPRPLTEIQPQLPAWVDRLMVKLLAKDREERFQSADEIADVLQACQRHVEQPSMYSLPEDLNPNLATSRRLRWTVFGVLISMFVLGGWLLSMYLAQAPQESTSLEEVDMVDVERIYHEWKMEDMQTQEDLMRIRAAIEELESRGKATDGQ